MRTSVEARGGLRGVHTAHACVVRTVRETPPFPLTTNVLDSTLDDGFVVFPLFWDGFESGST